MEVPIIIKTEVRCPLVKFPILLSLCRGCEHYRYETVDCKVMCNYIPDKKEFKHDS